MPYVTDWFQGPGGRIWVIDGASNAVIDTIAAGQHNFGVAVNPTTNRLYVGDYEMRSILVVDLGTNAVVAAIPVGVPPAGIAVDTATNRIFTALYWGGNSLWVIDGSTNTVLSAIATAKEPFGVALNPSNNHVYVTNWRSDSGPAGVSMIDGSTDGSSAQCQAQVAQLQNQVATLQAQSVQLQSQVTILTQQNQTLTQQNQALTNVITNAVGNVQQILRQTFNNTQFTIPGGSPQQQLQNLVTAIQNLNKGRLEGLYTNLGGKP